MNEHLIPQYPKRKKKRNSAGNDPILKVQDLSYRINGKDILKNITVEFTRGQTIAIVGANGSGKTTLIKHFNRLLRPTAGKVILEGKDIHGKSPAQLAKMWSVAGTAVNWTWVPVTYFPPPQLGAGIALTVPLPGGLASVVRL